MSKIIFTCFLSLITVNGLAQVPPKNWQLLDYGNDSIHGMSVNKARVTLLKNLRPKRKVIVAIIDIGMDVSHPAFKGAIWTNQKEISGNGVDDDGNGYIDDVHGWNFVGDCEAETYDCVREYVKYKSIYENSTDSLTPKYRNWKEMKKQTEENLAFRKRIFQRTEPAISALKLLNTYWINLLHTDSIYLKNILNRTVLGNADSNIIKAQTLVLPRVMSNDTAKRNKLTLQAVIKGYQSVVDRYKGEYETANTIIAHNDVTWFRKKSPGDDPFTNANVYYGNARMTAAMSHGNGVAGIIAASQTDACMKGISDWVEIMPIQIVTPKVIGEERDKDVANAIRYAVNNGAKIINISLGKQTSPQKELVDNAVRYAASKGVLIFAAAGNDATDNDSIINYPSSVFANGTRANNLFTVGATTYGDGLVWRHSNFGKKTVDFFAPGDDIYSTAFHGNYNRDSGTSYASPTAAGLAALIWNYYPQLDFKQVMLCIERSVLWSETSVTKPGTDEKVPFKQLSRTGGIINAYNALAIANKMHK
ncbi:S8 family serine peptidase [Mucilaginibacter glaciei]|uniref:S8 family serine peptidase n=1 Tax=Mucilaginibacter glaciei TaxID=2772109 RepID=A0A926NRN7_9SPHI|nr:S8 family serine peptidase [Mucilaginibacter glaciei]MBD1393412.1 S8 family serine peptidase [Mucilaginibacter glaciei]